MPIYEYVADYCVQSLFCSKRFVFRQRMNEPPVTACPQCEAPLSRILSSFSAGIDMGANAEAWEKIDAGSDAPPATLKTCLVADLATSGAGIGILTPREAGSLVTIVTKTQRLFVVGKARDQETGLGVIAAASSFSSCSVSSHPRQASVMETPCWRATPSFQACLPGFRLLSSMSPMMVWRPSRNCRSTSWATNPWRV